MIRKYKNCAYNITDGGSFEQLNYQTMTRDLFIRTKSEVRRYSLKKNGRPQTVINHHLYCTDESLMQADRNADSQFVMYDVESTQAYWSPPVDPDLMMA